MLSYVLALVVASGSFALYMAAFFFPEVHRKNDFIWSGVGLFYALVLWVCAERITGGVLLGQTAGVVLLGWLGWQTFQLRRQAAPLDQQTPLPSAEELKGALSDLTKPENLSKLSGQAARQFDTLKNRAQGLVEKASKAKESPTNQPEEAPYVPLTPADFAPARRLERAEAPIADLVPEEVKEPKKTAPPAPREAGSPITNLKEKATAAFGIVTDLTKGFSQKKEPKPTYVRKQFRTEAAKTESPTPTAKLVDAEPTIVAAELIDADAIPTTVGGMVETTVELVSDAPIEPAMAKPFAPEPDFEEPDFEEPAPPASPIAEELAEALSVDEPKAIETLEFDIPEPVVEDAEIDDWFADEPASSDGIEVGNLFVDAPESSVVPEISDLFSDEPETSEVITASDLSVDATESPEIPEISDLFSDESEGSGLVDRPDQKDFLGDEPITDLLVDEAERSEDIPAIDEGAFRLDTEMVDRPEAGEAHPLDFSDAPLPDTLAFAAESPIQSTDSGLLDDFNLPDELDFAITESPADDFDLGQELDIVAVEPPLSDDLLFDDTVALTTDPGLSDEAVIEKPIAEIEIPPAEDHPLPVNEFGLSDDLSAAISDLPPLDAPPIELESLEPELTPTTAPDLSALSLSDELTIDPVIPSFAEDLLAEADLNLVDQLNSVVPEPPSPDIDLFEAASEPEDLNLQETLIPDEPAMELDSLSFEIDTSTAPDEFETIAGLDEFLEDDSSPAAAFDVSDLGELFAEETGTEANPPTTDEPKVPETAEHPSKAVQYIDLNNLDLSSLDDSLLESAVEETSLDVESILGKATQESVEITFDMFGDLGDETTTLNSIPPIGRKTQPEQDTD